MKETAEPKYILVREGKGVDGLMERPTQVEIRDMGLGTYRLHRPDGTLIKSYRVVLNRNNNPVAVPETPQDLAGISTLNLNRMVRDYARIVKLWPGQAKAVKAIQNELSMRQVLIETAVAS